MSTNVTDLSKRCRDILTCLKSLILKLGITKTTLSLLTPKNTVISPNFLAWKFCGKAQFSDSFGRLTRNYAETVPFHKILTPGNQVKLRCFSQSLTIHHRNIQSLAIELFKIKQNLSNSMLNNIFQTR